VQGEIQQRDQQLTSTSKAAQQIRYQQALVAQPVVQGEYNTAVQRRNQLQASFYAQEQAAHGILMRLEALSQLSNGNLTVTGARFLLFLLFLVIECLPVTVKLLQRPGQYEAALEEAKNAERRDFKKAFATRSRFGPGGFTNGRFRNGSFPNGSFPNGQGGPAILQLEPEPGPSVGPIWNGGTRPLPITAGDYEDRRPTERLQNPGHVDGGRGFGYGSPADHSRQQRRWHGADEYRNYWGQRDPEEPPRETPRPSEPARDPYLAPTRQDPLAAQTRQDYGYAGQAARGDGYRPDSDAAAPYRDEDRPVYDAASEPEQEPVPAQSDGNGSGIPLNWDDE
jgi:hypothetical protein